jgi:NAD(P)-dependent dehydrogenase (short-subunit alcohol dehydrogenase family)
VGVDPARRVPTAGHAAAIGTSGSPAIPHIRAGRHGGAIVISSSTAGLYGGMVDGNPGVMGYIASKHGVVGLVRAWAKTPAPERIRVNTVHPTGVHSPMITNEAFGHFCPGVPHHRGKPANPLSVENGLIEREDVTNTILHLESSGPANDRSTARYSVRFAVGNQ